ncbi:hypothetical protein C4K68_22265 [Pokkaliibacter plantistimulans]|uniref:RcnB family protein n=1 Tax=Proteobacteria bacterium 228 TaxID=2083153 RepID=A0A2S5KK25_9PROT|nr:DUF6515 family protein [Pokkaliibacter plantistimulans]PPC75092.1 hypothetical protein C4K68_22265 [Pokkaliibacter plantistimulans]
MKLLKPLGTSILTGVLLLAAGTGVAYADRDNGRYWQEDGHNQNYDRDGNRDHGKHNDHGWRNDHDWHDRGNGWGNRHDRYRGPERVTVIREIPRHARRVIVRDRTYYVYNDVYYRPQRDYYEVVPAPFGAVQFSLPGGSVKVMIGGVPYYRHGGDYYWYDNHSSGFRLMLDM